MLKLQNIQSLSLKQEQPRNHINQLQNLIILIIVASCIYLVATIFTLATLLVLLTLSIAILKLCHIKYNKLKKQGYRSKLSQGLRKILFELSIFDIFNDAIYFDTLTPIITAFIKPAITKPNPQQLHEQFQHLPNNVKNIISTKGLLNLAPSKIQQFVLTSNKHIKLPQFYGKSSWQWCNLKKYSLHPEKIHQQTIQKQLLQIIERKINLTNFSVLVSLTTYCGMYMKKGHIKNMFIQNGSFFGVVFLILIISFKIKVMLKKRKQRRQMLQIKQQNQQN